MISAITNKTQSQKNTLKNEDKNMNDVQIISKIKYSKHQKKSSAFFRFGRFNKLSVNDTLSDTGVLFPGVLTLRVLLGVLLAEGERIGVLNPGERLGLGV